MKFLFILCLIVLSFSNTMAQERFVMPVDEAEKDTSFLAFRTKLIEAVKKRDAKYILSIVDQNIKNSFGGNNGIKEFKEMWKINDSKSEFWNEFLPVITNGGKFIEGGDKMFCAPYSFTESPDDLDAYGYSVIFGKNVNLRSKPDSKAKTIARLSYNVVKVDYENSIKINGEEFEYSWLKVETPGGKKGFVKAEFVRSPIDYRACFEKQKGKWKMIIFIAGD